MLYTTLVQIAQQESSIKSDALTRVTATVQFIVNLFL